LCGDAHGSVGTVPGSEFQAAAQATRLLYSQTFALPGLFTMAIRPSGPTAQMASGNASKNSLNTFSEETITSFISLSGMKKD
jgi:hypothetical protein